MTTAAPRLAARRRAVHAACRQLGMDEETRRDMLQNVAGVRSTTQLSLAACDLVLDHLRKCGADRKPSVRNVGQHPGNPQSQRTGCGALMDKIEAQLADMSLPWSYAVAILKKVSANKHRGQSGVEKLEWATAQQLHDVVAALAYEQDKRGLLEAVDSRLREIGKTRDDVAAFIASKNPGYNKNWARDIRVLRWLLFNMDSV